MTTAETFAAASAAREHAHAPYSRFKVGAALALRGVEEPVTGCNVENASYGATICAERNAIAAAVARHGTFVIDHITVVTNHDPPAVPCALCLQVLAEFCAAETPIHLADTDGVRQTITLGELLPYPFTSFTGHD